MPAARAVAAAGERHDALLAASRLLSRLRDDAINDEVDDLIERIKVAKWRTLAECELLESRYLDAACRNCAQPARDGYTASGFRLCGPCAADWEARR